MESSELKTLANPELIRKFKLAVAEERRLTLEVLTYFRECERRMLFAEFGYSSLLVFTVRELGYSEPAAYRRISAMRVLNELPETAKKIHSGELNLTTISQAQSFFSKSRKAGIKLDRSEKREVLNSLSGLSARSTEQTLVKKNPELFKAHNETRRALLNGALQVSTSISAETAKHLSEILDLLGRSMSFSDLVTYLAEQQVQILRKERGFGAFDLNSQPDVVVHPGLREAKPATASRDNKQSNSSSPKRKYLSRAIERQIWQRAKGCCEWKHPTTERSCDQRRYLQIEHILPVACGGRDEIENLQLLCSTHNLLRAVQVFGTNKMAKYIPSLRSS